MKKYVKPELFYEQFELSKHIASCAWKLNSTEDECSATPDSTIIPGLPSLFINTKVCDVHPNNVEDYCYQPGASSSVFSS